MSRFNTGNPLGSSDPRDLDDNAKNMDLAVNSEDSQWIDRFGRPRLPLMEQERQFVSDQERREGEFQADQSSREAIFSDFLQGSGYQDLGEYAPGIEITAHNQYVTFGGQPYLLKPSIPVPYTTSGEWTGDDFKLIGDDSLRQDLANPDMGAAMVARGSVTFDSITSLFSMDADKRKPDQAYTVKGSVFLWNGADFLPVGPVNVEAFGADPNNLEDSSTAFNVAGVMCFTRGWGLYSRDGAVFRIDEPVDLRRVQLDLRGSIRPTFDDRPQVIIGGRAQTGNNPDQFVNDVLSPTTSPAAPNIRCIGSKGQNVRVNRAYYFQLWADSSVDSSLEGSSAYSNFDLKYIDRIELNSNEEYTGTSSQWITENEFRLKRCRRFIIDGTYGHNNNRIYGGAFEGENSEINIIRGTNNRFYDIRFESGGGVRFGELARDNSVEYTWTSIFQLRPASAKKEDLGLRNRVVNTENKYTVVSPLVNITADNTRASMAPLAGVTGAVATGSNFSVPANTVVYLSDLIPFTSETRIAYKVIGPVTGGVRCRLIGYDADGNEIVDSDGEDYEVFGAGVQSFASSTSVPATNTDTGRVLIPRLNGLQKAAFVRLRLFAPGDGLTAVGLSAWVENPSYWGGTNNEWVVPPVTPPTPAVLLDEKTRRSLASGSYTAGQTATRTGTWPGLQPNTVISCSIGSEVAVPDGFVLQAHCHTEGQVTIKITNASGGALAMPSGAYAHLVAHTSVRNIGTIV